MMVPIVFIHYGDTRYLHLTLACAQAMNPGTDIYLLGDEANRKYANEQIRWKPYEAYQSTREYKRFIGRWQYISTLSCAAERKVLFTFLRWFYLYQFMVERELEQCWYFDSDTVIASNLDGKEERFRQWPMTVINHISGCVSLVNDREVLQRYMALAISLLKDQGYLNWHKTQVRWHIDRKEHYSLCDMSVFGRYQEDVEPLGEASEIIGGETFDPNISLDRANIIEHEPVWKMEKQSFGSSLKRIYWQGSRPYFKHLRGGTLIGANTLNLTFPAIYFKDHRSMSSYHYHWQTANRVLGRS